MHSPHVVESTLAAALHHHESLGKLNVKRPLQASATNKVNSSLNKNAFYTTYPSKPTTFIPTSN